MTSREIVRRTLDFDSPERVARSFEDSDFRKVSPTTKTKATEWREPAGGRWERYDEWGNRWARIDRFSKGEVAEGVLEDFADFDSYRFPDYSKPEDYERVRKARREQPDGWLIGTIPGFAFNIARKMRRLEQYLIDVMVDRERIHELHDRIDTVLEQMVRNYAAAGVDSVMFGEDWGTQTQTLVSPAVWYEEFYPRFRRLCGIAHQCGIRVFMHSCGNIAAIVPGLIRAGIDVLQFDQPDLHGIDTLAGYQEDAHITFWCPVDIQTTLQTQDEALIRGKALEMLDKLWGGRGGFIAGFYGDNNSIGLEPMWQEHASDEFRRSGVASRYT